MSIEKSFSGRQDIVRSASQRAVNATFHFGITAVRSDIKKRSHRPPADKKVFDSFQDLLIRGNFVEYISALTSDRMRLTESKLGKSSKEWSHDELLQAYEDVESYFLNLSKLNEPPKGRPPKLENQGIINMAKHDAIVKRRKLKREKWKNLVERFPNYMEGAFARKEKEQYLKEGYPEEEANDKLGTLEAWYSYKKDNGIDTSRMRIPPGTFDRFLERNGVDPMRKDALKIQISRARRYSS